MRLDLTFIKYRFSITFMSSLRHSKIALPSPTFYQPSLSYQKVVNFGYVLIVQEAKTFHEARVRCKICMLLILNLNTYVHIKYNWTTLSSLIMRGNIS